MKELKINKLNPVLLDCYNENKLIGTVSNSYEALNIRIQIAEQKLDDCFFVISPDNTNWDYIDEDDFDIIISIDSNGNVDKWFKEVYVDNSDEYLHFSVYNESLSQAIKLRKLQKM
jgi:hypothetical protein